MPKEITVRNYGDYFEEFLLHAEVKAADPDGTVCHPWSNGLLGQTEVTPSGPLLRLGKEANV